MTQINFVKGGNTGAIRKNVYAGETTFIAVTAAASKTYKTEKSARAFMARAGYEEIVEAAPEAPKSLDVAEILRQLGIAADAAKVIAAPANVVSIETLRAKREQEAIR